MTTFDELHPRLQELLEIEGFTEPTEAQAKAFGPVLDGQHTLLLAPTGMGKTEAAVLPILDELIELPDEEREGFVAIYVTPLRALNRDILSRLEDWCEFLDVSIGVRHGDTTRAERRRQSKNPPEFLITTPETLQAVFTGSRLREHLRGTKFVVVDEIHELVGNERGAQLSCALERVTRYSDGFQRVGLSATVGNPEETGEFLAGRDRDVEIVHVPVGKRLEVGVEAPRVTDTDEVLSDKLYCGPQEAALVRRIVELVEDHTSTLVFVNTRRMAEVLAARLGFWDVDDIRVHHGSLHKEERVNVEEAFKAGEISGLICTSSMELGIDIGSADFVVQINSPREVARLLQRVGRSGHRVGLTSKGKVLCTDADDVAEALVIAEGALAEEVETAPIPENPLDVLANQLEAMSLEGDVPLDEAMGTLRRARPFWSLDDETAEAVIEQMESTRLVERQEGNLTRLGRARLHFVENLSMIPDQTTFLVRDVSSRRPIGTLDEAFVMNYVEPGALVVLKGEPWRVVEVEDEEETDDDDEDDQPDILVAPVKDPTGAVPSWVGQEIPVPYDVAQGVGRLRARIRERLDEDQTVDELANELARQRPTDEHTATFLVDALDEQGEAAMPTDRTAVLETGDEGVVLNACLGHKANEALGTVLSGLIAARIGESVGVDVDPYRVMLELPRGTRPGVVQTVLEEVTGSPLEGLIETLVANQPLLRFKLVHVARKFGVLDKSASSMNMNVRRLLDRFEDTPLYDEAVREILHERIDVPRAEAFLDALDDGTVDLVKQRLSPVGQMGFEESVNLVSPGRATGAILGAMRDRLEDEPVVLHCMHCNDWTRQTRVKRVREPIDCPKCGAQVVTVVRPWVDDQLNVLTKDGQPSPEEAKTREKLETKASLLSAHGKDALTALVARGVGPTTAGRILAKQHTDEDDLLRDLMQAEIDYARTREFWD
jgi:ATP-dependent Lhr-like helicase